MPSLPTPLRKTLEGAVTKARREAEDAARAALDTLTVDQRTFHALSFADRRLRNSLRAGAPAQRP